MFWSYPLAQTHPSLFGRVDEEEVKIHQPLEVKNDQMFLLPVPSKEEAKIEMPKLFKIHRLNIYIFLDANFRLARLSALCKEDRAAISDYQQQNRGKNGDLIRLYFSPSASFPNPIYFNHLLTFTDHIELQFTKMMSKSHFKLLITTLINELQ